MKSAYCSICRRDSKFKDASTIADPLKKWWFFECLRCGTFFLSDEGKSEVEQFNEEQKLLLSAYLRNNSTATNRIKLHHNVVDLLKGLKFFGPVEAAEKFLLYLEDRSGGTSNPVPISQENDFPLFYLRDPASMNVFMAPLQQKEGLIAYTQPRGWHLTYEGHKRVAELKRAKAQVSAIAVPSRNHNDLWDPGMVRVFLSHLSSDREAVGSLKERLQALGVSAFVAHTDIVPSLPWLQKIENALESTDCLVALMVPDFKKSNWTDHEVGMALGRGIPVMPVMLGAELYGFIASRQGIPGDLTRPNELALSIFGSLVRNPRTSEAAIDALVLALERSGSYIDSLECAKVLPDVRFLNGAQIAGLNRAKANSQVAQAYMVSETIDRTIARVRANGG